MAHISDAWALAHENVQAQLASREDPTPDTVGESYECVTRVGTAALVDSDDVLKGGRRKVTFAIGGPMGSPGGVFSSTSDSIVMEATNGDSCDRLIAVIVSWNKS